MLGKPFLFLSSYAPLLEHSWIISGLGPSNRTSPSRQPSGTYAESGSHLPGPVARLAGCQTGPAALRHSPPAFPCHKTRVARVRMTRAATCPGSDQLAEPWLSILACVASAWAAGRPEPESNGWNTMLANPWT